MFLLRAGTVSGRGSEDQKLIFFVMVTRVYGEGFSQEVGGMQYIGSYVIYRMGESENEKQFTECR